MIGTGVKVLVADAVLLLSEYLVNQDIQARVACALGGALYGSGCLARSSPAFSYNLLTDSFSMIINGNAVHSPPTLDWVQVTAGALILVNVWYVYKVFRRKSTQGPVREQLIKDKHEAPQDLGLHATRSRRRRRVFSDSLYVQLSRR